MPSPTKHYENTLLGEPFKKACQRRGYTQIKLAKALKVSYSLVEKWSRGAMPLSSKRKKQIERLLSKGHVFEGYADLKSRKPKRVIQPQADQPPDKGPCRACDGTGSYAFVNDRGQSFSGDCCACKGKGRRLGKVPTVSGAMDGAIRWGT